MALGLILDKWLDCMPSITQPERRKLLCMSLLLQKNELIIYKSYFFFTALALCSLITAKSDIILDRICGLLLNVSETLNDIMKEDDDGAAIE